MGRDSFETSNTINALKIITLVIVLFLGVLFITKNLNSTNRNAGEYKDITVIFDERVRGVEETITIQYNDVILNVLEELTPIKEGYVFTAWLFNDRILSESLRINTQTVNYKLSLRFIPLSYDYYTEQIEPGEDYIVW